MSKVKRTENPRRQQPSPKIDNNVRKTSEYRPLTSNSKFPRSRAHMGTNFINPRNAGGEDGFFAVHDDNTDAEVQKIFFPLQVKDNSSLVDLVAQQRMPREKLENRALTNDSFEENDESITTEVSSFMLNDHPPIVDASGIDTVRLVQMLDILNREYNKRMTTTTTTTSTTTFAAGKSATTGKLGGKKTAASPQVMSYHPGASPDIISLNVTSRREAGCDGSVGSDGGNRGAGVVVGGGVSSKRRANSGDPNKLRAYQKSALQDLSESRQRAETMTISSRPTKFSSTTAGTAPSTPSKAAMRPQTPSKLLLYLSTAATSPPLSGRASGSYSLERHGAAPPCDKMFDSVAIVGPDPMTSSPPVVNFIRHGEGRRPVTKKPEGRPIDVAFPATRRISGDDVSVGSSNSAFSFSGNSIFSSERQKSLADAAMSPLARALKSN